MKNNGQNTNRRKGQEYWLSYSDMMAALLLMFILIMAVSLYQSIKSYEDKERSVDEKDQVLKAQAAKLDEQSKLLEVQKNELQSKKDQLSELNRSIGVKKDIIKRLNDVFMNSGLKVQVDGKTGAISFASSILFNFDSSELTPKGEDFLRQFVPRYSSVLLGDEFSHYIAEIIVEGHADPNGEYLYNLELSQMRALAVSSFFLDEKEKVVNGKTIRILRKILTSNGRSFSDPVYRADGKSVDMAASRRVVFKFRLQDEKMIEDMQRILEN